MRPFTYQSSRDLFLRPKLKNWLSIKKEKDSPRSNLRGIKRTTMMRCKISETRLLKLKDSQLSILKSLKPKLKSS
jgi:hypothetical protein